MISKVLYHLNRINLAGRKISFDYNETLTTPKGMKEAERLISEGEIVYIISASSDKDSMLGRAEKLGIPSNRVYATGSNKAKIEKILSLGITSHYDNNEDVINKLKELGINANQY